MKFRIELSGTQTEGPEARTRFEKIVRGALELLESNGFHADYAVSTPDMDVSPTNLLSRKSGDPEPASWQAAVLPAAERAPAKAEAATVVAGNVDAVSPAAARIAAIGTDTTTEGSTDGSVDVAPTDAELVAENDSSLALSPDKQTAPQINASLKANDYTGAELTAALATEKAGRNRPAVVSALEAASAARAAEA